MGGVAVSAGIAIILIIGIVGTAVTTLNPEFNPFYEREQNQDDLNSDYYYYKRRKIAPPPDNQSNLIDFETEERDSESEGKIIKNTPLPSGKKIGTRIRPTDKDNKIKKIPPNQFPNRLNQNYPKIDINQFSTPTPPPKYQLVATHQPEHDISQFIWQPVVKTIRTIWTAPRTSDGDFDFTEIGRTTEAVSKEQDFLKYIYVERDNRIDKEIEKDIDITNTSILFANDRLLPWADIGAFYGLTSLQRIAEAYHNYSKASHSEPIINIPLRVNIYTIKGVDEINNGVKVRPQFNQLFKPIPHTDPVKVKQEVIFDEDFKLKPAELMTLYGNLANYEGGVEEYQKYLKRNEEGQPDFFPNSFLEVPTQGEILNEIENVGKIKAYAENEFTVKSKFEMFNFLLGDIYVKSGLNEFPSAVPSIAEPADQEINPELFAKQTINDANKKNKQGVPLGTIPLFSLGAGLAWMSEKINKKIGEYPLEFETENEATGKVEKKKFNTISGGMGELLTLGTVGVALTNFGNNLNLANAGEIKAIKGSALRAQECACAGVDTMGGRKNPRKRCTKTNFNASNANGFTDMLKQKEECYVGTEMSDNETLKDMLEDIRYGVKVCMTAVSRSKDDLEEDIEAINELKEDLNNESKLNEFINRFSGDNSNINRDYPIKSQLKREGD